MRMQQRVQSLKVLTNGQSELQKNELKCLDQYAPLWSYEHLQQEVE